jgi:hypothetical protein
MKKYLAILSLAILCVLGVAALTTTRAAVEPAPPISFQYATIQWGPNPKEPYVIRPDGKVYPYGGILARENAPEGTDQHSYFMSLVMNLLGKEGYEFAGMTPYGIVMKRAERR